MNSVFRISRDPAWLKLEHWEDWVHFDQSQPAAFADASDIATAVSVPDDIAGGEGVFEFQRLQVRNGHIASARELVVQSLPAWMRRGATVLGTFELVHGENLPAIALLFSWQSFASAAAAQNALEHDRDLTSPRALLRENHGKEPFQSTLRSFREGPHNAVN